MLESNADFLFPYTISLYFLRNKFLFRKIMKHFSTQKNLMENIIQDSKT